MKIKKLDIIAICNLEHPDFGVFAKFLGGLSKTSEIEIPAATQVFLCKDCKHPLWLENVLCLYCLGLEDGKNSVPVSKVDKCEHTWTAEGKIHCIKCGIYQDFINPTQGRE